MAPTARPALASVVVPTYNRAGYVAEAIASVLAQTYPALELIVIDDGSTDGTEAAVAAACAGASVRVDYVRQQNRGLGAARNAGVARAGGEFLAFLDDDDLWVADKLERQLAVFAEAPGTDVVYGHAQQFVSPELRGEDRARLAHLDGRVVPAAIAPAMLIRRESFDRVGPFDESLRIGIEMDWYARLCDLGLEIRMLDALVYRRRLHRSNLNVAHRDEQSERLRVLKQTLDRRRARGAGPAQE